MLPFPNSLLPARPLAIRAVTAALKGGPLTASEIARRTGIGLESTLELLETLQGFGCARRTRRTGSSDEFEFVTHSTVVLGVDLGGTKVHLALSDLAGAILTEAMEPTDPRGGAYVIDQIGAIAERLGRQVDCAVASPSAAAIGSPGVLDSQSGRVDAAPNVPGFDTLNVLESLEARLECPVVLENDVNLAALGELWHGSCAGSSNFAFVALGTGIGMGLVTDGRLVRGSRGAAGEIAFLPIGSDPFDPASYTLGPLEAAIGSAGILRNYRHRGGDSTHTVREIFHQSTLGDIAALETIDYTSRILFQALMAIRAIADPALIVLGGSIGVRTELVERVCALMGPLSIDLPVRASSLGNRAVLVGATSLALTEACERLFGAMVSNATDGGRS